MDENDHVEVKLNGKTLTAKVPPYAPRGQEFVVPYVLSRRDVRVIIDAGREDAAKQLQKISTEEQRNLGISATNLVSFLLELQQLDRERPGKERIGLTSIKGLRLSRRLMYGRSRHRQRDDYGEDPVQMFENSIQECTESFTERFLPINAELTIAWEREMRSLFRDDDAATLKTQPRYVGDRCFWSAQVMNRVRKAKRVIPGKKQRNRKHPSPAEVLGRGVKEQMERMHEYYIKEFRRALLGSTPEAAWQTLRNAQKDVKNTMRRNMVACFSDDMNYFLVDLPYAFGFVYVLKELRGRAVDQPSLKFNETFYHMPQNNDLDGLTPALHPFGELLTRSKAFLRIAYNHFADKTTTEARNIFYGSLLATGQAYRNRCQNERRADAEAKRRGKNRKLSSVYS